MNVGLNRYFAFESYNATIEHFVTEQYTGRMPSDAQVLYQIAKGIKYLHGQHLWHGNINPRTILISQSQPLKMMIKVADFGLCKFTDYTSQSHPKHQTKASRKTASLSNPEYWRLSKKVEEEHDDDEKETQIEEEPYATAEGDEFAAGCMFFYFLKRGVHPFGDADSILENISKKNRVKLKGIILLSLLFCLPT